ncbi:MAG: hypothetical protein U1E69_08740 [Tabrizicola sp.]|uniref:hypothetical protein n=1 Tax=Tabrizicola sp. TaxID=2005166 RepID=UPI002AB87BAF|nr:hypothetical protein [Tabrizicola sp.]MDZ4086877.1 hypothetical protein [Tabrizicola sp.]
MLDRSKLPRTFTAAYQGTSFDFVVTNASDDASLVLNAGRDGNGKRLQYGNGLKIDRHAGHFHFSEALDSDLHSLRPFAMKLNAIPAKVLGAAFRFVGRLLGAGSGPVAVGGGDFAMGWNIGMLVGMVIILGIALLIGAYVILPLALVAGLCLVLDLAYFKPAQEREAKAFMESIADQVRDLVEETVSY